MLRRRSAEFHVPSISFLGYIISQGQIEMDPSKISVVAEWPINPNPQETATVLRVRQLLSAIHTRLQSSRGTHLRP